MTEGVGQVRASGGGLVQRVRGQCWGDGGEGLGGVGSGGTEAGRKATLMSVV